MFKLLQKVGKAFMLPIAILPAAGLLLGIGGAFSSAATIAAYPMLDVDWLQAVFKVMNAAGSIIFANLPMLLCVGLCIGLARRDKGVAALAGVVGYLVMTTTSTTLLSIFNPDGAAIDTGVVGALVIGLVAVNLHNRFHNIQLPQVLGFFGGSRFVPIVTSVAGIAIGAVFYLIWPPFQQLLVAAGNAIAAAGVIGSFFYGFLMRLCGAIGLHHMIYPMFWYTELGGTAVIAGEQVVGAQNIFFAQLADASHTGLFTEGTRFFAGRFSTMMFGLPAAALAMYHCVPKERRSKFAGLFLGVAATSFLTGITEPLEYMFLFVCPPLYVLHAFFDGLSFLVADLLQIRIGNTFSGGFIDFFLFGIMQGNEKTNWLLQIPFGAAWACLYYFTWRFLITKFNIMTPGRDDEAAAPASAPQKSAGEKGELAEDAKVIITALGGPENIEDVDACITRLRVSVHDTNKVDRDLFMKLGAAGVLDVDGGIQAVFGAKAILYKSAVLEELGIDE
ncbi:MAG: PTS glucose transporter subunit IIB [Coriobacteriaceae bacterium]|nr:PTS glucose transporter subunit IIB [Coriobacteriaceae bacterium]